MHRIAFFHQELPDLVWPEGRVHTMAYLTDWVLEDSGSWMLTVTWFQSCRRWWWWWWLVQAESGLCFVMGDQPKAVTLQKKACLSYLPLFNTAGAEIFTIQAWTWGQVLCWVMLFGLVLEPPAKLQPSQAASHTTGIQKPLRALSVTDTPANCWPLATFIQCSPFDHKAAVAGRERKMEGGMCSPQRIMHSTGTGRLVCPSAQAFHMQTLIYWVSRHTRQDACTPQEYTQKHMHTHPKHTERVITFVYTETMPVSWPRTHTSHGCICRQNLAARIYSCILLIFRLCHHEL